MKKQERQRKHVQKQLPKHVSKGKKGIKVDGHEVFWPGIGWGGFGVPYAGVGAGFGITPFGPYAGVGVGIGFGGYYGGWL